MKDDIELLVKYLNSHSTRLEQDISNAIERNDMENSEYYKGSKAATEMIVRLLNDIIKKHA